MGPPKWQMSSSSLARPSQEALANTLATWEGLGPSGVTNVFVRATWAGLGRPSQEAPRKTLATWEGLGPSRVANVFVRAT